ncbi:MAG: hypothetical protein RL739_1814 [Pseudomonadota bacterium]|jgi:hypothetical protein
MAHASLSETPAWPAIDWQAPWFQAWAPLGQPVHAAVMAGHSVADALNQAAHPCGRTDLCFVPQSELPKGQAYEAFIHAQQRIPTRDNLHDFFNGLCWLRFGRSKRRLNQLQAQEIARQGVGQARGALRDALTVFDENALLLQAPDGLWQALCARDWQHLFVHERHQWAQVRIEVFGHALLEKLVQPYVAITGHAWLVMPAPAQTAPIAGPNAHAKPTHSHSQMQTQTQTQTQGVAKADAQLDAMLCHSLQEDLLRRKAFAPLPVLGVPGWWSANEAPTFYGQTQVFRLATTAASDKFS